MEQTEQAARYLEAATVASEKAKNASDPEIAEIYKELAAAAKNSAKEEICNMTNMQS